MNTTTTVIILAKDIKPGDRVIRFGKPSRVEIVEHQLGFTRITTEFDVLGMPIESDAQLLVEDLSIWERAV